MTSSPPRSVAVARHGVTRRPAVWSGSPVLDQAALVARRTWLYAGHRSGASVVPALLLRRLPVMPDDELVTITTTGLLARGCGRQANGRPSSQARRRLPVGCGSKAAKSTRDRPDAPPECGHSGFAAPLVGPRLAAMNFDEIVAALSVTVDGDEPRSARHARGSLLRSDPTDAAARLAHRVPPIFPAPTIPIFIDTQVSSRFAFFPSQASPCHPSTRDTGTPAGRLRDPSRRASIEERAGCRRHGSRGRIAPFARANSVRRYIRGWFT
jgi:hypothetical protein